MRYNTVMRQIILIAHDLRSTHNVGSLLRTAEGLGIEKVYLTGYTPYPVQSDDTRLPHISAKIDRNIQKTALGAETSQPWKHAEEIEPIIAKLKYEGYLMVALEQTPDAIELPHFTPPQKVAIILGREVEGVEPDVLAQAEQHVIIPMFGSKESFNVVQAAAMMLYHCRFA